MLHCETANFDRIFLFRMTWKASFHHNQKKSNTFLYQLFLNAMQFMQWHFGASAVPVMEEYGKQSFGCLHHVVILLSKEHADQPAEVSVLHQLGTVPLQEDPQPVEVPIHLRITGDPCCEMTGRELAMQLNPHVRGVPPADKMLYCSSA